MAYPIWMRCLVVLLLSSVFWNGCAAVHRRNRTVREDPAPAAEVKETSWPSEKLAKAHAHYAAGVIHEMNNEDDAALEEFRQAALNDPDNEGLCLEVSRRFLQKKDLEKALEILSLATSRPKASGSLYARLGLVYGQLGKQDQALAADRIAIKRSPELLAGYQNLFTTLMQAKQQAEAL